MLMALIKRFRQTAAPLTFGVALAIAYLSLSPLETLPPAPGGDKLHHFIAYAVLCFPLLFKDEKLARYVLPLGMAYGGVIELIQPFANRYGEWLDFGANAAGCFIGYGLARVAQKLLA